MADDRTRDDLVEAQIRAARARGEFDELPGRGKPLELEDLDHLTSEQRFDALLLRSSGELSVRVALIREIRALRAQVSDTQDEFERKRALSALADKVSELQAVLQQERQT